jgi:hypothetical protein
MRASVKQDGLQQDAISVDASVVGIAITFLIIIVGERIRLDALSRLQVVRRRRVDSIAMTTRRCAVDADKVVKHCLRLRRNGILLATCWNNRFACMISKLQNQQHG